MGFFVRGALPVTLAWSLCAPGAMAQESRTEQPDVTRLDVERLPPEALEITRNMFARGLYVRGLLGGRGFFGGVSAATNFDARFGW